MKIPLSICCGLLLELAAHAGTTNQFAFLTSTLPSQFGASNRYFFSKNNAYVASMLTLATNGNGGINLPTASQTWDFSALQQPSETVLDTAIVDPAGTPDPGDFPNAIYAEQDTFEPASASAWRFYGLTDLGRLYDGFYEYLGVNADNNVIFDQNNFDIPARVALGTTWERTVTWGGHAVGDPVEYVFTATNKADAFGTLILPVIGALPALRVHEAQDTKASYYGILLEDAPCDYYYWLVPNLGLAVEILQNRPDKSGTLTGVNFVQRLFNSNYYTNTNGGTNLPAPYTNGNLHIKLQNQSVYLYWTPFTNSTSYQIQTNGSLSGTNWHISGLTSNTNWSDALYPTRRFYRVVGLP